MSKGKLERLGLGLLHAGPRLVGGVGDQAQRILRRPAGHGARAGGQQGDQCGLAGGALDDAAAAAGRAVGAHRQERRQAQQLSQPVQYNLRAALSTTGYLYKPTGATVAWHPRMHAGDTGHFLTGFPPLSIKTIE